MSFIDSYKRLEKLCSEIYGDNHGLSIYIDEMISKFNGSYYVPRWDEDLKRLKHYRWVRNQIWHEPGCTEENMCEPGDVQWLENFRLRIMSTNDPLALYRKATNARNAKRSTQTVSPKPTTDTYPQRQKTAQRSAGCLVCLLGALLFAVAMAFIFYSI